MNALKSMLSDGQGNFSTVRGITMATGAAILGVYVAGNAVAMIHGAAHVDFATNEVLLMGAVLAAKVTQAFSGENTPKP
jgi:hypothetical protein